MTTATAKLSAVYELDRLKGLVFEEQGQNLDVDARARECSCGAPVCEHLAIVRDLIDLHAKDFSLDIRSAFHKELRIGDVPSVLRWTRWFETLYGANYVRRYLTELLFEDTRNVLLLVEWQRWPKLTVETMVRDMLGSRKKWELTARHKTKALEAHMQGCANALSKAEQRISAGEVKNAILTSDDPVRLHETVWRVQQSQDGQLADVLKTCVRARAKKHGGDGYAETVADARWFKPQYVPEVVIEIITGGWDESANDIHLAKEALLDPVPVIPRRPPYIYDAETRRGQKLYPAALAALAPGQPQPEGIDVRWSDLARGSVWREMAYRQHGATFLAEQGWESVMISPQLWAHAVAADRHRYPKLHKV